MVGLDFLEHDASSHFPYIRFETCIWRVSPENGLRFFAIDFNCRSLYLVQILIKDKIERYLKVKKTHKKSKRI
jgi:hypothetical protein